MYPPISFSASDNQIQKEILCLGFYLAYLLWTQHYMSNERQLVNSQDQIMWGSESTTDLRCDLGQVNDCKFSRAQH